jgi:2-iminobutanoate/2-iminopropanoate deaminase
MPPRSPAWTPVFLGADIPAPAGAYSPAARAGDLVFVSGQTPRDPLSGTVVGSDVVTQSRQTLENVRRVLEAAGASLADVVSVTVYLADERDWGDFNTVYKTFFEPPYPARAVVGAGLRGIRVEISAVARVATSA